MENIKQSREDIEARLDRRIDAELASPQWRGLGADEVETARETLRKSFWGDRNRLDIALGDLRKAFLDAVRSIYS